MSEEQLRTYRPGKAPLTSTVNHSSIGADADNDQKFKRILKQLEDVDPRVRTTAIENLIEHNRKNDISSEHQMSIVSIYCRGRDSVSDDNEMVRAQAVELVRTLGQRFPELQVPPQSSKKKAPEDGEGKGRLANDAFAVLCGAVLDLSVRVRAKAARALGSIPADEHILVQTFDKKVMAHLRKKRTEHETMHLKQRRTGTVAAFGDVDVDVDVDSINLMSAGACGAFVHGLEDEFFEVREASIDSICALSALSLPLANKALDFLTDMFNDEIDSVRLLAVQGIHSFAARVVFHQAQVEIMLGSLDDKSSQLRLAMHRLLAQVRVASSASLHTIVSSLVTNLKRIGSGDNESVWWACRGLGMHNARLCECLVDPLMHVGVHFTTAEPNVDDAAYIAVVVLIANAAAINANVTTLLPTFFPRHHRYLCDRYPTLVPALNLRASCTFVADLFYHPDASADVARTGDAPNDVGDVAPTGTQTPSDTARPAGSITATAAGASQRAAANLHAIVSSLREGLDTVAGSSTAHGMQVVQSCLEQLRLHIRVHKGTSSRVAGTRGGNSWQGGAAAVHLHFCTWAVQFCDANARLAGGQQVMVLPQPPHIRLYHIQALHQHLDCTTQLTLRMLRALAHAQRIWLHCVTETEATWEWLVLFVRRLDGCLFVENSADARSMPAATRACAAALRVCQDHIKTSLDAYRAGRSQHAQATATAAVRQLLRIPLPLLPCNETSRALRAVVYEPTVAQKVITLTLGLPRAVRVRAHVYNLKDITTLRVRTKYPSGNEMLTRPSTTHVHETSGTATLLECVVYICNNHVADLFEISLSLGVTYTPDVPHDPILPGANPTSRKRKHGAPGFISPSTSAGFVAIAPPRKLHVKVTAPQRAA
eukprot:m.214798 g.214798  ORF g.214798 m.214798 type:complete len:881 (+) comp19080_c0_seq6:245-2887(+)